MDKVVGHKLATHHPVIEPVSVTEPGTEIYDAETGATKAALSPGRDQSRERAGGAKSPYSGRKSLTISGGSGKFEPTTLRPEPGLPNAANDLSGLIDAKNREHGKERGGLAVPKLCHCTAAYGVRFRTNVHFCAFLPERFPDFRVMPLGSNKSAGKYSVRQAAQATL